jgi:hypothetical protein
MRKTQFTRRYFLHKSLKMGITCSMSSAGLWGLASLSWSSNQRNQQMQFLKKGEKQLFVDDLMISRLIDIGRKTHAASKLERPILEADMPWEQGDEYNGKRDRRIYIYGTVLREKDSGTFRMWYNRLTDNYYATSKDGVSWQRPDLGQRGENNMIRLAAHSPSIIRDECDPDKSKMYKAIGFVRGHSEEAISKLKKKFKTDWSWFKGTGAYCAWYSADGLNWERYPDPVLLGGDTITLSQDPTTGEFLAFHKIGGDPRVTGRQVFLSTSQDMQNWSDPEPVMVTDEIDHKQARLREGGTHSEFYNMSAFPYANQWLGLVTHFRRTGEPSVKGPGQSSSEGPIDVQLVHSRDGRKWERCSDRSPVIPLGPHPYDSGSILGVCNSPVIVGDEMWMYYTAMTTTHGGYLPDKMMSIARAAWRLDGMVSLWADDSTGVIETVPFIPEGRNLCVNADCRGGKFDVEVLDVNKKVIEGYSKNDCQHHKPDAVQQSIRWNEKKENLPSGRPICLRFFLEKGDLFSYVID